MPTSLPKHFWLLALAPMIIVTLIVAACQSQPLTTSATNSAHSAAEANKLLIIDCLLPGQVRKLGNAMTYMTPRRPIKTSAEDCEIRGGEYVAFDRADYRTALNVWLETAKQGDAEAQVNVGEIFEKGLGTEPNYPLAVEWYRKAALQGNTRGEINLGYMYEKGLGVEKNTVEALNWYRKASGMEGNDLQFASTIEAKTEHRVAGLNTQITQLQLKLKTTQATLKQKQAQLSKAERQSLLASATAYQDKLNELQGPTIELLDPPLSLTRGVPSIRLRSAIKERIIIGKVLAPAGLSSLMINKHSETVDKAGVFQVPIQIQNTSTPVNIVATDKLKQSAELNFQLLPYREMTTTPLPIPEPAKQSALITPVDIPFGRYYAIIIGNNNYKNYPRLETAVNDAKSVDQLLREKYGFTTKLLLNADRYAILSALSEMRKQLTAKDNLLIYYAGHGELDSSNQRGHWLPVDAEPNNPSNWISNTDITDMINTMVATHVLVVADSCYSGALTRTSLARLAPEIPEKLRMRWYKVMSATRSRTALTSGGLGPVLDSGSNQHSVFANAFLNTLQNNNTIVEGYSIYRHVASKVTTTAAKLHLEQTPQYAPIRHSGHEAGEFLFVPNTIKKAG